MKKIICSMAVAVSILSSGAHAAGYGVVDLEKVVESSSFLKQQNAALQQSLKPQSTKLEQLGKELEAMQQKAQQSTSLSEADKQKMSAQYQSKMKEFNTIQQSVQTTVQSSIQSTNKLMDGRIKQAAEQLRKENTLDFILNKNSALAYDAKYDLTDKMIQRVNAIK
ncbi:OmpH family outer membrane protein [Acinetobacter chinensis]|jgi:outer membrane protein|uniref:OmpH family outer membrane protein n=1 Tax=Acinetobacter chinensis TaxID=2004650 RepID=UPI0029345261|nr:OmpH family outer membrane protein [Acinetobacter chinensis]WOE40176.1 OmpH family outer membrane protein [Acinetobacter chinensis]